MNEKLRKIVLEEVSKIIKEIDYDYAAEERGYHDSNYKKQDEAEISSSLSFMQDIQGSLNKLETQKGLISTNQEVDEHLQGAINHMNQAIQSYLNSLSPNIKSQVIGRLGEVNIEK